MRLFRSLRQLIPGIRPQFIIVGAQKAGTTSLYGMLTTHARIHPARTKEVRFFDEYYHHGPRWYLSHFPPAWTIPQATITGEATPYYLSDPRVPARIRAMLPDAKIVAILRDPVDRAISHYFQVRRRGREPLPIAEAMRAEAGRLAREISRMGEDERYLSRPFRRWGYQATGRYAEQLDRYLALFPREQVLIIRSEDFFARPQEQANRLFEFLGVATIDVPAGSVRLNQGGYTAQEVPPEVYADLARAFQPHNERLYELLGNDWAWRRP